MAVVVISDGLRYHVRAQVENMFQAKEAEALKLDTTTLGRKVLENLFPYEHRELLNSLPKEYLIGATSLHVSVNGGVSFQYEMMRTRMPKELNVNISHASGTISGTTFYVQLAGTRHEEVAKAMIEAKKAHDKVIANRNAATGKALAVLKSFRTLAPALKAWPALWELLPKDVQESHKRIVTRTKQEQKLDENLDLSDLTVMVAAKKMRDANGKPGT